MKWHGKGKNPPISGTAYVLAKDRHETNPPDSSLLNNLTILDGFLKSLLRSNQSSCSKKISDGQQMK
jgi:hypothetical protein